MLSLFSNEEIITRSGGDEITLTNYRINYSYKEWGASVYTTIFLEDISSLHTSFKSNFAFLLLSIFTAIVAFFLFQNSDGYSTSSSMAPFACVVLAIIFLFLWFRSKRRTIEIYSNGGKPIILYINSWSYEQAITFLEAVQLSKAQRTFTLFKESVS